MTTNLPKPTPPPEPPGWTPLYAPGPLFSCEAWFLIVLVFLVGVAVGAVTGGALLP